MTRGDPVRRRVLLVLALLGFALAPCATEDEVHCEEAAARLQRCCPGFDPRGLDCETRPACHTPRLSLDESRCIEGRSCESLVADGTCDRARYATGSGPSVPDPYPICR